MKRCVMFFAVCLVAVCLCALTSRQASAPPEYKARVDEMFKGSKAADVLKEAKCNICHYGRTKKNRNDFGQAVNKHLNDKMFKSLKAGNNDEKMNKAIDDGLKAALKEKDK